MSRQIHDVLADLDLAMNTLRESMKGLPVRSAGFRGEHDELARAVSELAVNVSDCAHLIQG